MIGPIPLWAVVAAYALCANAQDTPASSTSSVYPIYGTGSASFLDGTNGVTSILIQGKARTYTQTQSAGGIEVRYPLATPTSMAMEARGHKKHHHKTHHKKKETHRKKKTHHKAKKHRTKKHSSSSKGGGGGGGGGGGSASQASDDDGEEPSVSYDLVDIQCGVATDGLPSDCTMYGVQQAATTTVLTAVYAIPNGVNADNFVNVLVPAPTAAGGDASADTSNAAPGSSASAGTPSETAASGGQTKQINSNPLSPSSNSGLSHGVGPQHIASVLCLAVAVLSAAIVI